MRDRQQRAGCQKFRACRTRRLDLALGFQQYMERLYWLSAMNRIRDGRDLTSALYSSLLLNTHRDDVVPAAPAARIRVRALAGVAKLLRMRVDR